MSGFFGVASKDDCVLELFYGVDYHSHLGTRRGGMAVYGEHGFDRAIHNIENTPFRTKLAGFIEVENFFCMRQKKQLRFYRTVSFGHLANMWFKNPVYSWVIPLNS